MPAHDDAGEFIDSDFQATQRSAYLTPSGVANGPLPNRPPTREEIEALVSEKQIKLAELKRAQEELERERAAWRRCAAVKSNFKPAAKKCANA